MADTPAKDATTPVQASGAGTTRTASEGEPASGGESAGEAYPNPNTGKPKGDETSGDLLGHGGQSRQAYHGSGQLGDEEVGDTPNANAGSRHD